MSNFYLSKALASVGPVQEHAGGSGYFNAPDTTLDPRLFDGDVLKPEVRNWILNTFFDYFGKRFHDPKAWSIVWLAGSGISYQWSGDRSNGDLDVLVGVDFPSFWDHNRDYVGFSEVELADLFNSDLKTNLWPKTAATNINGGVFEVTFYINPGATDIRDIHPYAAYNVSTESWTVRPPVLPQNPESLYPDSWWTQVINEKKQAEGLISRYNGLYRQASVVSPTSPQYRNVQSQLGLVVDQARAMFDDIHLGRKQAFGAGGQGYGDFHNFRWQAHKRFGTMQALNTLASARREADTEEQTALYGAPIDSAEVALRKAVMAGRGIR